MKRIVDEQGKFIVHAVLHGIQCRRSRSNGVTWSYFRRLQTSLAAEFRTDCSLSSRHFDAAASRLLQRSTAVMTKQTTAVFAASNGSDVIQLLINRSWRQHLLTSCQPVLHGPSSACRLQAGCQDLGPFQSVAHAPPRPPAERCLADYSADAWHTKGSLS